jgi:hypothetical protein
VPCADVPSLFSVGSSLLVSPLSPFLVSDDSTLSWDYSFSAGKCAPLTGESVHIAQCKPGVENGITGYYIESNKECKGTNETFTATAATSSSAGSCVRFHDGTSARIICAGCALQVSLALIAILAVLATQLTNFAL